VEGFVAGKHLGSRPMMAIGLAYKEIVSEGFGPFEFVKDIRNKIFDIENVARKSSLFTFQQLIDSIKIKK
jgi:hypothetical protein